MNSSPLKPQQYSEIQQGESKMDTEVESATERLPDEVLLTIFRYLSAYDLLTAEQVCVRWKSIVNICFATAQTLRLGRRENDIQTMGRCGHSVKSLVLCDPGVGSFYIDWIDEIANTFPNLLSIYLSGIYMSKKSLKALTVKCCKITRISLDYHLLNNKKIAILLKGYPGLKYLELSTYDAILGKCFRELGSSLEHLITNSHITKAGTSHIFSKCINLKSIQFNYGVKCDADIFATFCKKAPLQSLNLEDLKWSKKAFLSLSHLSLLEELELNQCEEVDSDALILISLGCLHLKKVTLSSLPLVCDRGLKALAQLRHLAYLRCYAIAKMTEESLIEIAKAGLLKSFEITYSAVSDRGLSAILAHCPQLHYLSVYNCGGVSDSTVDAAIQAVESRSSSTHDHSHHSVHLECYSRKEADEMSRYLLVLYLPAEGLIRYKEGFSHPLLFLEVL